MIPTSELILNPDGTVYHIALDASMVADTVITVGDPDRVERVSRHFDEVYVKRQHREFVTHTGRLGAQKITVISTGIGPDNIDIVLNELDAAVNVDPVERKVKDPLRTLRIIRVGTTGGLQPDLEPGDFVASRYAAGLDNLMNFYDTQLASGREKLLEESLMAYCSWPSLMAPLRAWRATETLEELFPFARPGITLTAPGFYAPQGRAVRVRPAFPKLMECWEKFNYQGVPVTNFEMETSALYGLGRLLGHEVVSVSVVIAQRRTFRTVPDTQSAVDRLIEKVLDGLCH
jgi:uridine phosphorylase